MPRITLRCSESPGNDKEDTVSEYICDAPGCPNIAQHVLGVIAELRAFVAVCPEHVPHRDAPPNRVDAPRRERRQQRREG